jgi:Protein of unknown function (DUF4031)
VIYVDDFRKPARVGRSRLARWSHLLADDREELHVFAELLGLKREWFQDHAYRWHYDVTDTVRNRAIKLGATPITYRDAGRLITRRRDAAGISPSSVV